jgi:glutathione synthase/RimK-type ligase-like ATP-grasp enzyme
MAESDFRWDICLITEPRYLNRKPGDEYIDNIFADEEALTYIFQIKNLRWIRVSWDDDTFDWSSARFSVFRTTWDYFERLQEFLVWFRKTRHLTRFINSPDLIEWNLDKAYLWDLASRGIPVPSGFYINAGVGIPLADICRLSGWHKFILKPAVSGTARHTYLFGLQELSSIIPVFESLNSTDSMILQEFQESVLTEGEVSLVMLGGRFSHAVRKRAKNGDFRVQDDFGGTLHSYDPEPEEIQLAEKALSHCPVLPLYARVDLIRDKQNNSCVSELEMIEPELWFRRHPEAAARMTDLLIMELEKTS